jgi:hypothetical protein
MLGPLPRKCGDRTMWRGLLRAARSLALVVYVLLIATGALTSPQISLLLGVLLAIIGAELVASLHQAAEDLPALPHPLVAGVSVGSLPAAVAGTTALGASPGIVIALGLALGAAAGAQWIATPPLGSPARTAATGDQVTDERSLRQLLRALPTDVLFAEWRRTRTPGGARGSELLLEVRMRELLIDEMQRRDPAGSARWLREGPGEPPDGYTCVRP